mmetsp:Transcript_3372/g.7512  ORF Transcript_3372/g.7512 Transcript_3372/m.7512 type:complete len:209 (-) Transcript_3372:795-1421(-)
MQQNRREEVEAEQGHRQQRKLQRDQLDDIIDLYVDVVKGGNLVCTPHAGQVLWLPKYDHTLGTAKKTAKLLNAAQFLLLVHLMDAALVQKTRPRREARKLLPEDDEDQKHQAGKCEAQVQPNRSEKAPVCGAIGIKSVPCLRKSKVKIPLRCNLHNCCDERSNGSPGLVCPVHQGQCFEPSGCEPRVRNEGFNLGHWFRHIECGSISL